MKKIVLFFLLVNSSFDFSLYAQSNPQALKPGIGINRIMTIRDGAIRVGKDPVTHKLYYLLTDGSIYEVIQPSGSAAYDSLVFSTAEHGVEYVQGMTFHDSTLYLAGNNNSITPLTKGIVVRGKLQLNGSRLWDTLMITEDYQTADYFDHMFTGIAVHPSGDTVYVCSGARGDHGEIQSRYGLYPGLRGVPVTTLIFSLPTQDSGLIVIQNDSAFIDTSEYVFSKGIRSTFDMAFDSNGNLFGVENSGDYDHNEEMNLLLRGHHYGYPWKMGDSENPQQFSSFNPAADLLINHYSRAWKNGFWNVDSTFPQQPSGITFDAPLKNYGPDCDKYRDSTGQVNDASDNGIPLGTFSAHRSPLGLVFDNEHVLGQMYSGDAFMLSWTKGYDSCGCTVTPDTAAGTFVDPSQDLVHLDLFFDSLAGNYALNATRIIGDFDHPVDADIDSNKVYVVENGYGGISGLFEITFIDSCDPVVNLQIPDPCINNSNFVSLPAFGRLPDYVYWYDSTGTLLKADTVHASGDSIFSLQQGSYYVVFNDSGTCGIDTITFTIPDSLLFVVDSVSHTSCIGCADGIIYFTVMGGSPPYSIIYSGGILTGNTITNLTAGTYFVGVADSNCNTGSQAIILDDPTSISSVSGEMNVFVYPNPNNGRVSLRLSIEEKIFINVIDAEGKIVKQVNQENLSKGREELSFDLSGLSKGIYTLEIKTENRRIFKKLVLIN